MATASASGSVEKSNNRADGHSLATWNGVDHVGCGRSVATDQKRCASRRKSNGVLPRWIAEFV